MLTKEKLYKRIKKSMNLTVNLFEKLNNFKLEGPLGTNKYNCSNKELKILDNNMQNSFFLKKTKMSIFYKNFREAIRGIFVPWLRSFAITGYQYKIAYSYKRHQLCLGLGFTYWIILDLTTDNIIYLKTIKGKLIKSISRRFILASIDYTEFQYLQKFLNETRNLLPYKLKGLTFPGKNIKLKAVKKK